MIKCRKCGREEEAYNNESQCKKCSKEYQKNYRLANPEKAKASVRKCSDRKRFGAPREEIIRDRCEICGSTRMLSVHHRDGQGRNSGTPNNSEDNLQTLCNECHVNLHVRKWAKRYDPQWQEKVRVLAGLSHSAVGRELGITHECVRDIRRQIGYEHTVKYGRPLLNRTCTIDGCTAKHEANGLCKNHYQNRRRNGQSTR